MLRAYAVLAGIIATLVIGNTNAESKHSPAQQHPVQTPSANHAQPSTPDQRGPNQIPLPVKIIPGEPTKEQAEKDEHERREKSEKAAIDRRIADDTQRLANETRSLADYTFWLAGFTSLLFLTAFGQVGLFAWQLRLIKESVDSLPIIEGAYVYPVILKHNLVEGLDALKHVSPPSTQLRISFHLKNFGKTPAILQYVRGDLAYPGKAIDAEGRIFQKTILGSGEITETFDAEHIFSKREADSIEKGKSHLDFYGRIIYADIFGNKWALFFEWRYSHAQRTLVPDNQPRKKITKNRAGLSEPPLA